MESALSAWQPYYVIIGAAAATLTGLLFVVITLIAGRQDRRAGNAVDTFNTPTLIHFCAVLLISALINVPWSHLGQASVVLGLTGLAGVVYLSRITWRLYMIDRRAYRPVMEDWLGYAVLPLVAYGLLLVAAILLPSFPTLALFGIGAVSLLLLFVGIHNAWDVVTYIVIGDANKQPE